MRNLRKIRIQNWLKSNQFQGKSITAAAWDTANDSVLCTLGPSEENPLIELIRIDTSSKNSTHSVITSWDAPCPNPSLACDLILSLHFFGDSLTACLVLAGGDIVVVREDPLPGEDRIEIVGSVDAGITAAKWSPDEELLAITTKENTLVFMSRSFEGITDVPMTSEDLNASTHVSVGWGKKETQFKGKGAKALRDPTMPEKIDDGVLSPNDDSGVSISWRGDGAYLAISSIEGNARRVIRVYSREGIIDSVSEPVDGLEGALSWRPSGNLIAGIQRFPDRVDVVFFERNGLRHGQFSLRLTPEQVKDSDEHIGLFWNSDSTVLAVVLRDSTQLWTMGNYHWYLKQEIRSHGTPFLATCRLVWHPEKALRIITTSTDSVRASEYVFTTARGSTIVPNDQGVVAVIDGQSLKVTPFATANIPPPMALHDISVDSSIIDIALNADASSLAVLHQTGISLFEWKSRSSSGQSPILKGIYTLPEAEESKEEYHQISFSEESDILLLDSSCTARLFKPNHDTSKIEEVATSKSWPFISVLSSFIDNGQIHPYGQDAKGLIHSIRNIDSPLAALDCKFPDQLPWVELNSIGESRIAFGLSHNGHLYANSRLLVKNCTSYVVTPAHLIFTTTTHLIKFVHITNVENLEIPPDDPEKDERCRSIERGARLVTAIPTTSSVILQMPRGNLETIFPRAMVIAGIRALIEAKNYRKAFTNCRTQRVDMNILYDHAPAQFLANVPLFIDQVKKISYIDLFLSSLREEDVTQSMYKETRVVAEQINGGDPSDANGGSPIISQELTIQNSSKVNKICDAFLTVLQTRTSTNLQNIITANVCKSPPALEDGLKVVAHLMAEDTSLADKAVEHICFLADVNLLYENALGLYNLELALLVAQQSQKDPREYLPFLQNLQEQPPLRREFAIDDYLSRHAKALLHLHAMSAFEELQSYTQKHTLYKQALLLYRYNPTEHATLTNLYAEHLESKSNFKEAALAYESLHNYVKATSCYLSSGAPQWRETLFAALSQTPSLSPTALRDLATSLYEALTEAKDHFAAASIQKDYLSDLPSATKSLCKGYFFADALHLAALSQRPDLIPLIDTGLADAVSTSTELLAECKAQLLAQVPRIRELRAKALADPLAFYEGEHAGGADVPDDMSVAASSRVSTSRSLFTRYTGRDSSGKSLGTAGTGVSRQTSKNRKREERKRARGKKGSVYEEEYLVASVGRLVSRVEDVREEVGRLVEGCVRRGMWERGRAVEAGLAEVVEMCRGVVGEVFGAVAVAGGVDGKLGGAAEEEGGENGYKVAGGDAVYAESLEEKARKKDVPVIKAFEKLALLGG